MALTPERIQKERERAVRALAPSLRPIIKPGSAEAAKPRGMNTYTDMVEEAKKTYRHTKPRGGGSPSKKPVANEKALILPAPTPEALRSPARAKAESEGWAMFGQRTWYLVQKGESFRAAESLDDARGWSLVERMKR